MLTIFRRHGPQCSGKRDEYDRTYRRCSCLIHVEGQCGPEFIRQALKTSNWQAAQARILEAEARGSWEAPAPAPGVPGAPESTTIAEATQKFLKDAEHGRRLDETTLKKYKLMLRDLEAFAARKGFRYLKEFNVEHLRGFRESWFEGSEKRKPLGPRTALKKLERVRAFFRFGMESGWIETNVAKLVKAPTAIKEVPKLPFTEKEMATILEVAETIDLANGTHDDLVITNFELVTFVLSLRYSGLRIGDASLLQFERLDGSRLFLYTQKTGQPVYVPLPQHLVERLGQIRLRHGRYFFTGPTSTKKETTADLWRRKLGRVFRAAKIAKAHPHRFRHTFAVELLKAGVKMENVSILLGHNSTKITEKHYSAWVKDRQDLLEEEVSRTWGKLKVIPGGKKVAG